MKTKNPRNSRKDTDEKSTLKLQIKVTPKEHAAFSALAWFRELTLAEHIRALLKADLADAERRGMWREIAKMRDLLAATDVRPAKKRKG